MINGNPEQIIPNEKGDKISECLPLKVYLYSAKVSFACISTKIIYTCKKNKKEMKKRIAALLLLKFLRTSQEIGSFETMICVSD